ncbi:MAG TPA: hypothetical protein VFZ86_05540 [Thermoleophilia bacterium]|nr:hypothetical protein [Thermoleophilia bacterium]
MKRTRIAIITIQLLVMLNAFGGGYYGLSGAPGVDPAWLDGTPFSSYFVPSLFLFTVIGGGMAVATAAWILKSRVAPWLSLAMGVTLMSWIVVQVAMIGYVSWMQPVSFVAGAAVAALAGSALRGVRRERLDVPA